MSLLVSYLVVSKVYLSLDRYMEGREAVGGAMGAMRELHQAALIYSAAAVLPPPPPAAAAAVRVEGGGRGEAEGGIIDRHPSRSGRPI